MTLQYSNYNNKKSKCKCKNKYRQIEITIKKNGVIRIELIPTNLKEVPVD
jgi:hypothetical protein